MCTLHTILSPSLTLKRMNFFFDKLQKIIKCQQIGKKFWSLYGNTIKKWFLVILHSSYDLSPLYRILSSESLLIHFPLCLTFQILWLLKVIRIWREKIWRVRTPVKCKLNLRRSVIYNKCCKDEKFKVGS